MELFVNFAFHFFFFGYIAFWIVMITFIQLTGCTPKEYVEFKKQEAASRAFGAWKMGFIAPRGLHYIDAIESQSFYLFEVAKWERLQVFHHVDEEWYDIDSDALRGYVRINKEGVIGFSNGRHLVETKYRIMLRVNEGGPCYILDPSLKKGERNTWHERWKPYRVERKVHQRQQWPSRWEGTSLI